MLNISMVRAKCYLILQGLERSLLGNLIQHFNIEDLDFFSADEQERALDRLRKDLEGSEWGIDDIRNDDLLAYLDLGDLMNLLNRHKSQGRNILPEAVEAVTRVVSDSGLISIRNRVMHPRSLAGKPLAGFRATPSRRNPVLYGMVVYAIRFTHPLLYR